MSSKSPVFSKSSLWVLVAMILIGLGIFIVFLGQIWIAPIVTTLGLGLLVKHWPFQKVPNPQLKSGLSNENGDNFQPPQHYCISFWNLPLSRILVIISILTLAIVDAVLFRTPFVDRYNPMGNWQILMGPTLFYPLVVLPLVMAIGMIIYLLFTIRKITLTRTDLQVTIQEQGLIHFNNHIQFDQIVNAHYCSNFTGLKVLWLIPWSIQIWGNFASAWHYFTNEFTFGVGRLLGPIFLIHSIFYFVLIIVLLFTPEYELGWESSRQECLLRWYGHNFNSKYSQEIFVPFLSLYPEHIHIIKETLQERKRKHYFLGLGSFLFILLIVSLAVPFFFSDIPRIFIFMGAIASLGVFWKEYLFKDRNKKGFGYEKLEFRPLDRQSSHHTNHHSPLEIMLYFSEICQLLSIGVILTTKWRIYPILSPIPAWIWVDLIASSILGLFMIFLYLKKQWEILEESNKQAQLIGGIFLVIGIILAFLL